MAKRIIKLFIFSLFIVFLGASGTCAFYNGSQVGDTPWAGIPAPGALWVSGNVSGWGNLYQRINDQPVAYTTTLKLIETFIPANVARGSTVTVSYVMENTGDDTILVNAASLSFFQGSINPVNNIGSEYTITPLTPIGFNLLPNTSTTFNFSVFIATNATTGSIVVDGVATGNANGSTIVDDIWQDITGAWNSAAITANSWNVWDGAIVTVTSVVVPPTRSISTTATFNVTVNILNTGGVSANLFVPSTNNLVFWQVSDISTDYSIVAPAAMVGGGLVLGPGASDTLVYQVVFSADNSPPITTGSIAVIASISGTGDILANNITGVGTGNFFVETAASLSVSAIDIVSPNGAQDFILSAGQSFVVSVNITNYGEAGITGPAQVQLAVPAGYTLISPAIQSFMAGGDVTWSVTATNTFLSLDVITVNMNTIPLDVNNLTTVPVNPALVTAGLTIEKPAQLENQTLAISSQNFLAAEPQVPPIVITLNVQNVGSADAILTPTASDLVFTVSSNPWSGYTVTIPSSSIFIAGNGDTKDVVYWLTLTGTQMGWGTLNATVWGIDQNSNVPTESYWPTGTWPGAAVTFYVTGNTAIVNGQVYTDRNPIGYLQPFQAFVPITNSSTDITANVTPSDNDLIIWLTAFPGVDLTVSFNVLAASTTQFQLFPGQSTVITYNIIPSADAIDGIYSIGARSGAPAATNNANGQSVADASGGIPTTDVRYDTISPNVIAVSTNVQTPVGPTNNFILIARFDEEMLPSSTPVVSVQCAGATPNIVGGTWSTIVSQNDTYTFNPTTILAGNEGWVTISFTGGGQDLAGNYQATSNWTFYIDATAPTCAVTINAGEAVTTNSLVTLTIEGGDDITTPGALQMMIYGDVSGNPGITVNQFIPYQQTVTINLDTIIGTKNIYVVMRDEAGNISVTANDDIFLDYAGAYFVSPSMGEAIGATYNLKVNSSAFSQEIYYYYIDSSGNTTNFYVDTSPGPPYPYNYDWITSLIADPAMRNTTNVTLWASVSTSYGVTYDAYVSGITIDNEMPTATVTLPINVYISGLTTFGGTATDNLSGVAVVEVNIVNNNPANTFDITVVATGTENWTYQFLVPTVDPDGTRYSVSARARDNAGNWGSWSAFREHYKDTSSPTVNIYYPPDGSFVHRTIIVTGDAQGLSDITLVEFSTDGGFAYSVATGTANWSFSWTVPGYADGTPMFLVARAYAGNSPNVRVGLSSMFTVYADDTSPNSTITSLVSGDIVASTVNVWGTADDGFGSGIAYVDISFDGGATWASANGTTNWYYNGWVPNPAASPYNIMTRAVDLSLTTPNMETPNVGITVYHDYAALPAISIVDPPDGSFVNNIMSVTGLASAGGTANITWVQIDFGDGNGWVTASGTSTWNYNWLVPTADPHGTTYSVTLQAMNSKGILGQPSPSVTYIYTKDIYPPAVSIITPGNNSIVSGIVPIDLAITVSQAALVSSSVGLLIDGNYVTASFLSVSNNVTFWRYNWDSTAAGGGLHTLVGIAWDTAGNVGYSTTVSVGSTGAFRTTIPVPAGNIINGSIFQPTPNATSSNVIYFSNLNTYSVNVVLNGTIISTVWSGTDIVVTLSATEQDNVVNFLITDPATGQTSANSVVVCYDVTPPTVNAWFGGVNRLIQGSIIAPNVPFNLNVIDNISPTGSGFGLVPTYDVFAGIQGPGTMLISLYPAGTTVDSTSTNRAYVYNVGTEVLATTLINVPAGLYDLYVKVVDNAGNISSTFNVLGLSIQAGANGTSGKIDENRNILPYPNPWDPFDTTNIQFTYFLTDGILSAKVYIYNEVADLVQIIERNQGEEGTYPGYNAVAWNGEDINYRVLANGVYLYVIVTKGDAAQSKVTGKFVVLRR
ncbi:Ig-like domain-containing protein [Candidatus Margulisiibacteriota bacterium]